MIVARALSFALIIDGAKADILSITSAGAADGFSLSSFVTGFPSPAPVPFSCCGPLGLTVEPDGNVLVDSSQNRTNYVFADTDGQTLSNALGSTPFNAFPPAYAASNGYSWGSWGFEGSGSGLVRFNPNGTVAATFSNIPITNGLWRNPVTGDLLVAGLVVARRRAGTAQGLRP
jgi:hypothetical protein